MSFNFEHIDRERDFPDVQCGVPCCMGYAARGPGHCTCWEPVYDMPQTERLDERPARLRMTPCDDCAYRGGSPERSRDPMVKGDPETLERLALTGEPFFCHVGIRRVIGYRHPCGAIYTPERTDASYDPPRSACAPHKADGTPADLCAGWASRRLALARSAHGGERG